MSVDRIFEISIAERGGKKPSSVDIINCLLKFGWSLYSSENTVIYTGLGDSDDFDFLKERITESEYFRIVTQKELSKEVIAFSLFYEENCYRYRINTLIMPNRTVVISPDDETRKLLIPDLNILDTNWYFSKILPPLLNADILIETYSFQQY